MFQNQYLQVPTHFACSHHNNCTYRPSERFNNVQKMNILDDVDDDY